MIPLALLLAALLGLTLLALIFASPHQRWRHAAPGQTPQQQSPQQGQTQQAPQQGQAQQGQAQQGQASGSVTLNAQQRTRIHREVARPARAIHEKADG